VKAVIDPTALREAVIDPAALREAIKATTSSILARPKPNRQQRRAAARRKQHAADRSRAEIAKAMKAKAEEQQ